MTKNNYQESSHKPVCPACGSKMQRIYIREYDPGKRAGGQYAGIGWICRNPHCNNIARD